jgi:hypothetical protein
LPTNLVEYLRRSLRLDSAIDDDPAYTVDAQEMESILNTTLENIDSSYGIVDYPSEIQPVVILLAKKEVYWRLATATAPLYPLQAEGAGLQQNVRFDHYVTLIQKVEEELQTNYKGLLESLSYPDIANNIGDVVIPDRYYTQRNYSLASAPKADLKIDTIYSDKVEVSWDKFDVTDEDGKFANYNLYLSKEPVLDFYSDKVIDTSSARKIFISDIHRTKYRVKDLESDTTYYLTLEIKNFNTLSGYSETTFTTEVS